MWRSFGVSHICTSPFISSSRSGWRFESFVLVWFSILRRLVGEGGWGSSRLFFCLRKLENRLNWALGLNEGTQLGHAWCFSFGKEIDTVLKHAIKSLGKKPLKFNHMVQVTTGPFGKIFGVAALFAKPW